MTSTNFFPSKLKKKQTMHNKSSCQLKRSFLQKSLFNYQNQKKGC